MILDSVLSDHTFSRLDNLYSFQLHNKALDVGGRETVRLSHVVLGDNIIRIFNDEM